MYFSGLDLLLAFLYLCLIWREASYSGTRFQPLQQGIISTLWQLPGIVLAAVVLLGLGQAADFSYYSIFILQLWHTPVLPLISLFPLSSVGDKPLYYYILFLLVPLLWIFYWLPALFKKGKKI